MKPAIEIKNLGKEYKLSTSQPYMSLRDVISDSVKKVFIVNKKRTEKFLALDDISLNIPPGESVGIIGRNGAGKSTLLKIISRITPPSKGEVTIRGKVGSLLEVGTGFHPELNGRENIYLNGSILGLKKAEIAKQFEAIVDFSGVEKFLETPLKHYSTGMQLRLAFSVAAHLEPEILLIDEVLAVGDIEFQKKCLGKMEEVSKSHGRTILFVSHNMNYISSLCSKAILLDKGKLAGFGPSSEIINKYIQHISDSNPASIDSENESGVVRLKNIRAVKTDMDRGDSFATNEAIGIEMEYDVLQDGHVIWLGYNLFNQVGINVFDTHNVDTPLYNTPHSKGTYRAVAWIPPLLLNTGIYFISCAAFNHQRQVIHFHKKDMLVISVYDNVDQQTAKGMSPGDFPGVVRPLLKWEIGKISSNSD